MNLRTADQLDGVVTHRAGAPRRGGVALVAVLWVVMIASLAFLGVQRGARVHSAAAYGELHRVQARWLARAGVEQAIAVLYDDLADVDSKTDYWYEDEYSFEAFELVDGFVFDVYAAAEDDGEQQTAATVRYGLTDYGATVNINVADEKQIDALTDQTLEPEQIATILDWRDQDQQPRPGGAEATHYGRLDFPYRVRNGELATLRELRLIHRIDATTFFGEDANLNGLLDAAEDDGDKTRPDDNADGRLDHGLAGLVNVYDYERNQTADGGKRVNINEADANALQTELYLSKPLAKKVAEKSGNPKYSSVFDLLEVKADKPPATEQTDEDVVTEITLEWIAENLDELTLSKEETLRGRVNVNTASRRVLLSVPEMTQTLADSIISYRASALGPVYSVGDLYLSNTIDEEAFRALAEKLRVRSNVFGVTSRGRRPDGVQQTITAVIDRASRPIRVLYWYQSE